jgi:hypothetical protein
MNLPRSPEFWICIVCIASVIVAFALAARPL